MLTRTVLLVAISLYLRCPESLSYQGFQRVENEPHKAIVLDSVVPKIDTLKESLRIFYQIKSRSEEEEFKYSTKLNFLGYLPSIGYDAFRQSPMVNLNISSIYSGISAKREKKAKLSSIQKINEVQYNLDLADIISLYNSIKRKIDFYNSQVKIYGLENKRFEITKRTYSNKEIVPSEYLAKEIDHYNFLNSITQLELEIYELRDAMLNKSKKAPYERLF